MDNWLKYSKSDLAASETLYKNKHYSQAAFYFQQSVEKLFKSLLIFFKSNPNKLRKHSHAPVNALVPEIKDKISRYEKAGKHVKKYFKNLIGIKDTDVEDYYAGINQFLTTLRNLKKQPPRDTPGFEIKKLISESDKIYSEIEKVKKQEFDTHLIKEKTEELYRASLKFIRENCPKNKQDKQMKKIEEELRQACDFFETNPSFLKDYSLSLIYGCYLMGALSALSIITNNYHTTRYPDEANPLEFFNGKNNFIIHYEDLCSILKKTMQVYEEMILHVKRIEGTQVKTENSDGTKPRKKQLRKQKKQRPVA